MTAEFPQQSPESISELTAVARDTFAGKEDFLAARRKAAADAAARNLGGVSLADQFAVYDVQQQPGTEQLPPPPTDS